MISRFFIDRPIFAAVLSILITIAGMVAAISLPVAQYPEIAPPTVLVTASYPGANAQTVLDTVAAPIEQQVSGVENCMYMTSQCTNDGAYSLLVTFKAGTDANMAQVLVQNRVSLGLPNVPDLVQRQGVAVKKISPSTITLLFKFVMNCFVCQVWEMSPFWASAIIPCAPGLIPTEWLFLESLPMLCSKL